MSLQANSERKQGSRTLLAIIGFIYKVVNKAVLNKRLILHHAGNTGMNIKGVIPFY